MPSVIYRDPKIKINAVIYKDTTVRVKTLKVGTPVKRVTAGAFDISNLGGTDITGKTSGSILAYQALGGKWETTNFATGNNMSIVFDSAANTFTFGTNAALTDVTSLDSATTGTIRGILSASGDLSYNSSTGQFSFDVENVYTKANFDSDLGLANTGQLPEGSNLYYTDARSRGSISVTDAGGDGSLAYNNSTGVVTYTGPSASEARAHVSAVDGGGDGSFTYNSSTGAFTYTGPSAAEVRAHITANKGLNISSGELNIDSANVKGMFSGGTGVTYNNGVISIGQPVATTSDVTFNDMIISGNLTVSGTQTTVNTETLLLADNVIVVNSNATGSPTENGGIEIERGDATNKTLIWNESIDKWTVGSETFVAGTFEGNLTGNVTGNVTGQTSDISNHDTDDLTEGSTNQYHTTARARGAVSASGDLSYNSTTGVFSIDVEDAYTKVNFDSDLSAANTGQLPEGSNQYHTTERARGAVSVTDAGGDGSLAYNSGTGVITYTGPSASEVRAHFSAAGDLSYNSSTGQFSFDVESVYTKANFDSDLGLALAGGTGITYDSAGDVISITNTGVTAATYGSSTSVPQIAVNEQGQITSASNVTIAGVTGVDFDSANGTITIQTTGGNFTDVVTLDPYTTADLTENTNLYYTNARADARITAALIDEDDMSTNSATRLPSQQSVKAYVDSQVQSKDALSELSGTTDDVTEGSTNLYHTDARVDARITTASVTATGALMDSELTDLAGVKGVTISTLQPKPSEGAFANGDKTKLDGIETAATADQTDAEIKTAYENNANTNAFTDADHTKLDAIEPGATADQTDAEIRTAVESATDSNVFTDADHTKLNAIEASATADQTDAEIKTAYENNSDTNAFTDAEKTKLSNIEASADVTDTANVTAAGALMDSELTDLAGVKGVTISTLQVKPTEGAFADGDKTKLDGIEASADVTDTANVTSAGALMDSELTDLAGVKGVTISTLQVKPTEGAFVDGDKTKLDAIEASADVTDTANVTAAGALMDSELTDLAGVKGVTISTLQVKPSEGAFANGDKTKLDGIEASADVTDTANVTSAGALMDSELTSIADVKALDQSVISGASPNFTTTNMSDATNKRFMTDAQESKLDAIEASATADQTDAEIRAAVEAATDSNVFTDADHSKLNAIEASADVTDTANVTAAGALMDSEVDADIKTLSLPANTTISAFGKTLVDDADAATARTTLGIDASGTDNSTNVTLAGSLDYITISGQEITRNAINLSTDVTGTLPVGNMAATALTTVQTAANESAHLALTAQEGDVVVRSDQNKTYMHNGGSAGTMNDYTLLATPTDAVTSVNGNTGVVTVTENVTTNLTITGTDAARTIVSSDGTNAVIPVATDSVSGVMSAADHTKLSGIETSADVTDTANVTSAGALMDSEVTNLAQVKAFDASDYATSAQGTKADSALQNVVEDSSPQLGGNLDLNSNDITGTGNISTTGDFTLTDTTSGSAAGPELTLHRDITGADANYLGQIKFTGDNDADQSNVFAKITGKISDASDGTEDGLIEFALKKAGSNNIGARLTSTDLKLINGTGLEVAGNITVTGTVDGRDVATDGTKLDGVEASADVTDTANVTAAGALMDSELTDLAGVKGVTISTLQPKPSEGAFANGDKTKLDGIEASADVTDTTNVTAAGALMDSELTDLAGVKGVTISTLQVKPSEGAFADGDKTKLDAIEASADVTDTANVTAAGALMDSELTDLAGVKGVTISTLQPKPSEGAFANGDKTKLDGIEASADVTDTANVTSAGALMDSELASIADVKALDQSVVSGASPTFGTANMTDASNKRFMTDAQETKLDSVESSATADQTAAEILTAIKTVDGASSGLDADLLDGVQGSSYLRSDANDTFTGNLTVAGKIGLGDADTVADHELHIQSASPTIRLEDTDGNQRFDITQNGGTTNVDYESGVIFKKADATEIFRIDGAGIDVTGIITATSHIDVPDNSYLLMGTGDDLQLYHDGSNSYVRDVGTGDLYIDTNSGIHLYANGSETMLYAQPNAGVQLFYDNVKKIETVSSGIEVSGTLQVEGATGETIRLHRDDTTVTGGNLIGQIAFSHNDDTNSGDGVLIKGIANGGTGNSTLQIHTGTPGSLTEKIRISDSKVENKVNLEVTGTTKTNGTGYNPANTQWATNAALITTGSYGGGLTFVDGSAGYSLRAENSGADFVIGQGATSGALSTKVTINSTGLDVNGTVEFNGLSGTGAVTVTNILDEDNMASNSATALATQQSIKAYVDANAGGGSSMTDAEVRAAVEAATDSNVFTDADHSKLNGIEASATADQTAAQILTAIKTVDGSGSGLDADTVDGVQGSSFLRSDANDTATGIVTFNADTVHSQIRFTGVGGNSNVSNDSYAIYQEAGAWSHPYPDLVIGYHTGIKIGGATGYGGIRFYNNNPTSGDIIASIGNGDNHFRGYHEGYLRHGGSTDYKIWTEGNDGSGSGLDADTLDGVQGSSYLRSDASDTFTGTLTMAGTLAMGGQAIDNVLDIYLKDKIFHHGDTNTYMHFSAADTWKVVTGGTERLNCTNDGTTVEGHLFINDTSTKITEGSGNVVRIQSNSGYVDVGPQNTSYSHFSTDRAKFYFNKEISVDTGIIRSHNEDLKLQRSGSTTDQLLIASGSATFGVELNAPSLKLTSGGDASLSSTAHVLQLGPTSGTNMALDGNEIMARNNGAASSLIFQNDGGNISACSGGGTTTFGGNLVIPNIIYHAGDTNTYMQFHAADQFRVVTGGTERLEVNNSAVTVAGVLSVGAAIDLIDNKIIRFGSSDDVEFFFSGSHMYTDLNTGDWYIRDGTTNRFLFNDNGDFHADANIFAYSTSVGSDRKLKDNIEVIESPLEKIQKLNGVTFNWKRDGEASAGVIAQDVQKVLPSAVKEVKQLSNEGEDSTRLNVDYNQIIGLLVESVKELKKEIEELKKGK